MSVVVYKQGKVVRMFDIIVKFSALQKMNHNDKTGYFCDENNFLLMF